jgi:hypothetical protein
MTKWLLLLGFTLSFGGNLRSMQGPLSDSIPQQEPEKKARLAFFIENAYQKCFWQGFLDMLSGTSEWSFWKLSTLNIDQLNTPCKLSGASGLFEAYLMEEIILGGPKLKVLQHLIVNGLDVEVKKNGRYVFELYGDKFITIFEAFGGLGQYTFKKPLSTEFKQAYQAYKLRCENKELADRNARDAERKVRYEEWKRAQTAEERALLLQKIKGPLVYTAIGVCIVLVGILIYKKYAQTKAHVQNGEEADTEQQEAADEVAKAQCQE